MLALPDDTATAALGRKLAGAVRRGDFVALWGDLGVGKTTVARALIQARLAAHGLEEEVPSPTFTLVQTYQTPDLEIAHVDLYRIGSGEEADELGLDEALDRGAVILEWPDRLGAALPAGRLDVYLELAPDGGRRARLLAWGSWRARLGAIADA